MFDLGAVKSAGHGTGRPVSKRATVRIFNGCQIMVTTESLDADGQLGKIRTGRGVGALLEMKSLFYWDSSTSSPCSWLARMLRK
jgi:hypothetical protein